MVCTQTVGMSSVAAREVASTCNACSSRVQSVAEMLLLTSDIRPLTIAAQKGDDSDTGAFRDSFVHCRDWITSRTKRLFLLVESIAGHLPAVNHQWTDVCRILIEINEYVVQTTEASSHAAYLIGSKYSGCRPAISGCVDRYAVTRAGVDIAHACARLKYSPIEQLNSTVLITFCSEITRNLALLTETCRQASERTPSSDDAEQFRLCVKSVTSIATCLLASVRSFRLNSCEKLHQRCVGFADALTTATSGLVNFATETDFIGEPAFFTGEARIAQNSVLGACMSVVSSCVQLYRCVHSLAFDSKSHRHRTRADLCLGSLTKSTNRLDESLASARVVDGSDSAANAAAAGDDSVLSRGGEDGDEIVSEERNGGDGASSNRSSGSWESSDS
ncbi:talin rod domain-containing protein 1-like [Tubulanus polymorphus]|uniref:talin rod domain-containing protein 1-like n=1 Tax=Tubulanus polymorphus TaxID=672921 RepID=UPI003DA5475C